MANEFIWLMWLVALCYNIWMLWELFKKDVLHAFVFGIFPLVMLVLLSTQLGI